MDRDKGVLLMKEKYLLDMKKAMFWHFSSSEIRDTLEELNEHFESAYHSGLTDDEIIREYGLPQMAAKELREERNPVEKRRRRAVTVKGLLLVVCALSIIFSFSVLPFSPASHAFVLFGSVFIWFLAGNHCVAGVLALTKEKKDAFLKGQMMILGVVLLLHVCTLGLVPGIIRNAMEPVAGEYILLAVYAIAGVLFVETASFLRKMLQGNVAMFFLAVQSISIISGLFLYIDFLKRIDEIGRGTEFVLTPYFGCLPVLLIYGIYVRKAMKHR